MGFDVVATAKTVSRFEFIATFVARMTRKNADRGVTSGLRVVKVRGGWVYGFADLPAHSCEPKSAADLYDVIRRTALNYYVQQAEHLRIEALTA